MAVIEAVAPAAIVETAVECDRALDGAPVDIDIGKGKIPVESRQGKAGFARVRHGLPDIVVQKRIFRRDGDIVGMAAEPGIASIIARIAKISAELARVGPVIGWLGQPGITAMRRAVRRASSGERGWNDGGNE